MTITRARFSVRRTHLDAGWLYVAFDRAADDFVPALLHRPAGNDGLAYWPTAAAATLELSERFPGEAADVRP